MTTQSRDEFIKEKIKKIKSVDYSKVNEKEIDEFFYSLFNNCITHGELIQIDKSLKQFTELSKSMGKEN